MVPYHHQLQDASPTLPMFLEPPFIKLKCPFVSWQLTRVFLGDPDNNPDHKLHGDREFNIFYLMLLSQHLEWCLSHSKFSINICSMNICSDHFLSVSEIYVKVYYDWFNVILI